MKSRSWPRQPLGDLVETIAMGPFGSSIKKETYQSSGVPVINGKNLHGVRLGDDAGYEFIGSDHADKLRRSNAFRGDVVVTHRGTLGQVSAITEHSQYHRYIVSQSQLLIRPDKSKLSSEFLSYYLRSDSGQLDLLSFATQTGVPAIAQPSTSLRRLNISVPPILEQQAIAQVLGALDDKIAANTKLALLVADLGSAKFTRLGLDAEPSNTVVLLGEVFDLNPRRAVVSDSPTVIDMQALPTAEPLVGRWNTGVRKGGTRFSNGDTLIARITPCLENRKTAFVDFLEDGEVGIGSTEFIVMRSKNNLPLGLSYFMAISERFREFAIQNLVGTSGRQRVSASDLARHTLRPVEDSALQAFGEWADANLEVLGSLRSENRTLATMRDALLPQLMSGKLRVKEAEELVSAAT